VHEAFIKLDGFKNAQKDRGHFFGLAARGWLAATLEQKELQKAWLRAHHGINS